MTGREKFVPAKPFFDYRSALIWWHTHQIRLPEWRVSETIVMYTDRIYNPVAIESADTDRNDLTRDFRLRV